MVKYLTAIDFREILTSMAIIDSGKLTAEKETENLFWLYNSNTNHRYLFKFLPIFYLVTIWHDDGCVSLPVSSLFMFSLIPLL